MLALQLLVQETDVKLKALIALALLSVLTLAVLATLSPILLKIIVDSLAPDVSNASYWTLGAVISAYAGSQWLVRSLGEIKALASGRADQHLHRRLSLRLYSHVMSLSLWFHLDRKAGGLSQTLANGLLGYRLLVHHLMTTVLPVLCELATIGAVLLLMGRPAFFWIISAAVFCYAISFSFGAIRLSKVARDVSMAHIDANALLTDSILNYEAIKSFCAEGQTYQRLERAFADTEALWTQFFSRKAANGVLVGTVFAISLGSSICLAAREIRQGRMTLGEFVLVNTYMLQIVRPMEMLGIAIRDIAQGMAFVEKMIDLFRQTPEPCLLPNGQLLPPGHGELAFEDISFSYNEEQPILKDVNFRIPAGRRIGLIGMSGSGKSSLIRLLVRFWEPDSGRIVLDGMPISEVKASSLRGAIAIVPQDTILFNDTIANNIAMGCPGSSAEEIIQAARVAHIHDAIVARANGYETLVGERGLKLSGGEKQRIAIARAALKKPRLYVFDEATSSLDSSTEREILRDFAEVSQGRTTLVIAHRLSAVVDADEILVLENGTIVHHGTHQDLLQHSPTYQKMWLEQFPVNSHTR